MLVLTRKVGDVIAIGDNIKIVVMAIKGKQVRLGVQADRSTVVHREEIYQKIQQEIRAALQSDMSSTKAAGDLLKSATDSPKDLNAPRKETRPSQAPLVRKAAPPAQVHADSDSDSDFHGSESEQELSKPEAAPASKPPKSEPSKPARGKIPKV